MKRGTGPADSGPAVSSSPLLREPGDFYDRLAEDYDLMTGFEERFDRERPWFRKILMKYGMTAALDAGCGTGFHSILLSQLGVRMTAIDISGEMVGRTQSNAERMGVDVTTIRAAFPDLHHLFMENFGAVFCLGNTLPHLLSRGDLLLALGNFAAVLETSGTLFIQLQNYEKILRERKKVLNEKRTGEHHFVRSYDYGKETITFTVSVSDERGSRSDSVLIRPLLFREVALALKETGFGEIQRFGGLNLTRYDPGSSPDLVVIARRVPA